MLDSTGPEDVWPNWVSIKNLQLPFGVVAANVWNLEKEQPAVMTVKLALRDSFTSAANGDVLDENTVNYGALSKRIRACSTADQTPNSLLDKTETCIMEMGLRSNGLSRYGRIRIELHLPKASMHGESVCLARSYDFGSRNECTNTEHIISIERVKVMTLIGVNDYERKAEQPLVITLTLSRPKREWELFRLEHFLVARTKTTSFQTLEALAGYLIEQIRSMLDGKEVTVKLDIEKPRALPFADAPVISVTSRPS